MKDDSEKVRVSTQPKSATLTETKRADSMEVASNKKSVAFKAMIDASNEAKRIYEQQLRMHEH